MYGFEQPHIEMETGDSFKLGNTQDELPNYIVKIRDLEKLTGMNFFPMLQDDIEKVEPDDVGAPNNPVSTRLWANSVRKTHQMPDSKLKGPFTVHVLWYYRMLNC